MGKTELFQNCTESELPLGLRAKLDRKQVTNLVFSPDGTRLAAGGDGRIWLYDATSGAQFAMLSGYTERIRALAFAPDNTLLASWERRQYAPTVGYCHGSRGINTRWGFQFSAGIGIFVP